MYIFYFIILLSTYKVQYTHPHRYKIYNILKFSYKYNINIFILYYSHNYAMHDFYLPNN